MKTTLQPAFEDKGNAWIYTITITVTTDDQPEMGLFIGQGWSLEVF